MEKLLYFPFNNRRDLETDMLPKTDVKTILIIRNNKRIGNVLFLIPFVRQMKLEYPQAEITLMLNQRWQGSLFNHMGLKHICYSEFSLKKLGSSVRLIRQLNKHVFDLIVLPTSSVGDSLIAATLRGKNKISPYSKNRTTVFSHNIVCQKPHKHSALNPLELLDNISGGLKHRYSHHLCFSLQELKQAHHKASQLRSDSKSLTIAYFRGARGKKLLPDQQWKSILTQFDESADQDIHWVEILSPDVPTALDAQSSTFFSRDIRHLGAVLRYFDGFICCDTGPLHLADAAGAKCIGLYTDTNPDIFGVIGNNCTNVSNINQLDTTKLLSTLDNKNSVKDIYQGNSFNQQPISQTAS